MVKICFNISKGQKKKERRIRLVRKVHGRMEIKTRVCWKFIRDDLTINFSFHNWLISNHTREDPTKIKVSPEYFQPHSLSLTSESLLEVLRYRLRLWTASFIFYKQYVGDFPTVLERSPGQICGSETDDENLDLTLFWRIKGLGSPL